VNGDHGDSTTSRLDSPAGVGAAPLQAQRVEVPDHVRVAEAVPARIGAQPVALCQVRRLPVVLERAPTARRRVPAVKSAAYRVAVGAQTAGIRW
jgi:hypothetical protein